MEVYAIRRLIVLFGAPLLASTSLWAKHTADIAGTESVIRTLPRPVRPEAQTLRLDKDGKSDLFQYRETSTVTS